MINRKINLSTNSKYDMVMNDDFNKIDKSNERHSRITSVVSRYNMRPNTSSFVTTPRRTRPNRFECYNCLFAFIFRVSGIPIFEKH